MLRAQLIDKVREMREAEIDKSENFTRLIASIDSTFQGRNIEEVIENIEKHIKEFVGDKYRLRHTDSFIVLFYEQEPLEAFYNRDKYELVKCVNDYICSRRRLFETHNDMEHIPHTLDIVRSTLNIEGESWMKDDTYDRTTVGVVIRIINQSCSITTTVSSDQIRKTHRTAYPMDECEHHYGRLPYVYGVELSIRDALYELRGPEVLYELK